MELGIFMFAGHKPDPRMGRMISPAERIRQICAG